MCVCTSPQRHSAVTCSLTCPGLTPSPFCLTSPSPVAPSWDHIPGLQWSLHWHLFLANSQTPNSPLLQSPKERICDDVFKTTHERLSQGKEDRQHSTENHLMRWHSISKYIAICVHTRFNGNFSSLLGGTPRIQEKAVWLASKPAASPSAALCHLGAQKR